MRQHERVFVASGVPPFVALDFETATTFPDSACAVGLVRVEEGRIVERAYRLIRPPRPHFEFTWLHGIDWSEVAGEPRFGEVWRELRGLLDGATFLAAHNASFDRGVLHACCESAEIAPPQLPFRCTVRIARQVWGIYPTKLSNVCRVLGIPLDHHRALSDAEACARIVLAAADSPSCGTATPGRTL